MSDAKHSPTPFACRRCGWTGLVETRPRCLACYRRRASEWKAANRDRANANRKAWALRRKARDPDASRAARRRGRSRATMALAWKRHAAWLAAGDVTVAQLRLLMAASGGRCAYCGLLVRTRCRAQDPRGFDHITPRARGGAHTITNMVVCCRRCNETKADATLTRAEP